jgi:transcription initiation factor TFIIE subunit alpha
MVTLKLKDPLVEEFVTGAAGDNANRIVRVLDKGLTDEQISRKTKLRVNDIRAVLNKLHYLGVIIYNKEKAKDSNWYTYTWYLKKERITELMAEKYQEELEKLQEKLSFEQNYVFFKCANGCEKLPFELAYEYDFKCPECGKEMEQLNDKKDSTSIEKKIVLIKKFLKKK